MDIAAIAMGSGDFNNGILDANGMLLWKVNYSIHIRIPF